MNAITYAIELFGSRRSFAKELGVTGEAVRKWQKNSRIPAERCPEIVQVVNKKKQGALSLCDLRPDLWPCEKEVA